MEDRSEEVKEDLLDHFEEIIRKHINYFQSLKNPGYKTPQKNISRS